MIVRRCMWQMLRVTGVGRKLLKVVIGFYVESSAYVGVGVDMSEWFPVCIGLRLVCLISLLLFYVYMDRVVRA